MKNKKTEYHIPATNLMQKHQQKALNLRLIKTRETKTNIK